MNGIGTVNGVVGLHDLNKNVAELSIWLYPEFWGQGFGYEAITTVCEFVL